MRIIFDGTGTSSYRLMDTTPVESLHSSFCCTWVVVFHKPVIKAFVRLELYKRSQQNHRVLKGGLAHQICTSFASAHIWAWTNILIRNDLNALNVSGSFEYLFQHVFRHSWIQSTHIQGSFIRFGCGASHCPSG